MTGRKEFEKNFHKDLDKFYFGYIRQDIRLFYNKKKKDLELINKIINFELNNIQGAVTNTDEKRIFSLFKNRGCFSLQSIVRILKERSQMQKKIYERLVKKINEVWEASEDEGRIEGLDEECSIAFNNYQFCMNLSERLDFMYKLFLYSRTHEVEIC